jgi:hypothetical protein
VKIRSRQRSPEYCFYGAMMRRTPALGKAAAGRASRALIGCGRLTANAAIAEQTFRKIAWFPEERFDPCTVLPPLH